jgi:hypothetical protein
VSPQLNEPPRSAGFESLVGKQARRHSMEIPIDFSKEQLAEANSSTLGQLIC